MKLGLFKTIAEPDLPPCWNYRNVRVKGYVGEVELPTDQYIRRPIDHLFQEACTTVRTVLPDGRMPLGKPAKGSMMPEWDTVPQMIPVEELDGICERQCARIVSVEPIDDYGSLLFKFKYWGVPER